MNKNLSAEKATTLLNNIGCHVEIVKISEGNVFVYNHENYAEYFVEIKDQHEIENRELYNSFNIPVGYNNILRGVRGMYGLAFSN